MSLEFCALLFLYRCPFGSNVPNASDRDRAKTILGEKQTSCWTFGNDDRFQQITRLSPGWGKDIWTLFPIGSIQKFTGIPTAQDRRKQTGNPGIGNPSFPIFTPPRIKPNNAFRTIAIKILV